MINERKIEKLEQQLESVQGRRRERIFTVEEIIKNIDNIEAVVKEYPRWTWKYLTVTMQYSRRHLRHTNITTRVRYIFGTNGMVKDIEVTTANSAYEGYGEWVSQDLILNHKAFEEHFKIENPDKSLINYLYKSLGFGISASISI